MDAWRDLGFESEADFLEDWIERLRQSRKVIIVEGKEDVRALKFFDIPFLVPLTGKALYVIVEQVEKSHMGCIILTDLDAAGKKLYGQLYTELDARGVQMDVSFRDELFACTQLRQIEGLVGYYKRKTGNYGL